MNQMKCLKYEERSSTSPVEERRAIIPHCAIANLVRIFDEQGCEILKAKKSNCCNTYSRREIFQLDKDKYDTTKSKRTVEINSIDKVSRRESVLIDNLREEVLKNIFSNYFDDNSFFSVEISHKDFERF